MSRGVDTAAGLGGAPVLRSLCLGKDGKKSESSDRLRGGEFGKYDGLLGSSRTS